MAKVIKPPYFDTVVNAGERRLLDFLEATLPSEYVLIPNVEIASTNPRNHRTQYWEYDLIVVAPHAIYNIENKDWKGRIEGDDNYWYLNDRQKANPLKTGRQKTAILASKLKEKNSLWGSAWVQNMVTLSHENTTPPQITNEASKVTFQLDDSLVAYIKDPYRVGKLKNDISKIQNELVSFLIGVQSKKAPTEKRQVEGYEIIEVLHQEPNYSEYLVRKGGIKASVFKRVKEYALQVAGLSSIELNQRELKIKNGVSALENIRTNPFIANVVYRIDEENHLFYEISDLMDEDSLRSYSHNKTFTFDEIITIIKNLIAALKAAHTENVYHRDINPDNIFMRGGFAILANFGKAYFTDHEEQGYTVQATLTELNASPYHPMEMVAKEASELSDIYSLGVLIYWLFVRKEPISSPFELDKLGGKLPKERLPSTINPALPKWLDDLCNKTILVDDSLRIKTITELESFINQSLKEEESKTSITNKSVRSNSINIDSSELKEGDKVDDYIIHKTLGKGGYSRVFKVKHTLQDEYYALKLFHESVNVTSVIDEYKSLIQLKHPNIVKFIWNGTASSGQFYTITEFLDGENLGTYTRTDARLPANRVYQVAKDILNALVALQAQTKPILHRDIKPQNIIWDDQKRFVLIDFNVASFADDNKDFVGTNPYLAPDLIADNYRVNWDKSADTFALGITIYELICKQYPWYPSRMPMQSKAPVNPKDVEPRLSTEFSDFLKKAISTSGEERFADASEMLAALEKIGIENILENKTLEVESVELENDEDFVSYLNSLYSQSKNGNSGTRANFNISKFDEITYTPTKLDQKLIPAVLDGQFKLLIITGNAGDGKTAFIRKIEEDNHVQGIERFKHRNGARFKINGIDFESNYDGSQDEEGRANNSVLEEFFKPFEGISNYADAKEGRIIAINEGRLVEFLSTSDKHKKLSKSIEEYFYQEGHSELPDGLMIINLNLRSVVGNVKDEPSLFRKQLKALTDKRLWNKCHSCPIAEKCFIKYNVDSFNDSAAGENIITRMEWLLRTVSLKRELHITMRDLRSFISYLLTRDHNCSEVKALIENGNQFDEEYWQYYYFNITNPRSSDNGNQDRLVKLLRETDIGEVSIPDLDRDLFFGRHTDKNYLEFAERKEDLLALFNFNKTQIWRPAHEQSPELLKRIKDIQKTFIRHQYFEGRAILINLLGSQKFNEETKDVDLKPSFLLRLPYHSVSKFVDILEKGDVGNTTKNSISRAISLNEGCDNSKIDSEYLVLASTEIKDASKSFRLFSLNDFELFVNKTTHLVQYLEYESDYLIFRHKTEKHIQLSVSLDLYEMLYFIQQGFSPSLNDLRGKFVELIIFKNLLENLSYNEVIVTSDNIEFHKISKGEENRLIVQPMIV